MAMSYGGIMYFPLNVSFFEDAPIELVEAKYGLAGVGAVMKLLCKLHKEKGYYLMWDKEQCTLFAHKAGIAEEVMEKIIEILIEKRFFEPEYFKQQGVLTSENIQKMWWEATKRRKRDFASLPYLMESCRTEEGNAAPNTGSHERKTEKQEYSTGGQEQNTGRQEQSAERQEQRSANRMQNEGNCMQPVDIFTENADNSEQSKVKQTKLKQTKAETEGGSPGENSFLTPPEYAYNRQTHNYDGLLFTLRDMRIQNPEEVNAILRLSDYGKLRGYVWQVIHGTRWSEVAAKGKYLIAALVKERKKKAAG